MPAAVGVSVVPVGEYDTRVGQSRERGHVQELIEVT